MKDNNFVVPILKWAGGKRQLLDTLRPMLPKKIKVYCEPFVGGGAMLFDIRPKKAIVNDINSDLILVYTVVRDNVNELIYCLKQFKNTSKMFYEVRSWDRNSTKYNMLSDVEKAARMIYLNKTCYNGLYRVNKAGKFNVPFGKYKNPNIVNESGLKFASDYFNSAEISFSAMDYVKLLQNVHEGDFVYLDPPYDPVSNTSNFTSYTKYGFTRYDQIKLRTCCDELDRKGILFMLSNSATDFILKQYEQYNIAIVKAKRAINSAVAKRGNINEVVIRNYE